MYVLFECCYCVLLVQDERKSTTPSDTRLLRAITASASIYPTFLPRRYHSAAHPLANRAVPDRATATAITGRSRNRSSRWLFPPAPVQRVHWSSLLESTGMDYDWYLQSPGVLKNLSQSMLTGLPSASGSLLIMSMLRLWAVVMLNA